VAKIAASMAEFGWTVPCLVAEDGELIAGHGRVLAAELLGLTEAPVIVLDHLTDEQRRAYRIADNKLTELADWDEAILSEELQVLAAEDFDLALIGFDDGELDALLSGLGEETDTEGEDDIPEPTEDPVSRPGDLWTLGEHRLLCSDATVVTDVEKLLGDKKADLCFCDPPYNVDYAGGAGADQADADGLTDFYGLQAMIAREMFVAGECFVRIRPRRAEDGLSVPMQLQLLQSEMLPFEKTETAPNGNRIRCGIEFNLIGRRVAYHFRRRHPGDSTDLGDVTPETVRVPAEDVLHIYRPIDAGQIRGLPHVAPAMVRLFLLDQYDDAELDRKKTAAMFAGFITKNAPEKALMGEVEDTGEGIGIASLEPGTLQVLLPGEDIKFSSPADVGGGYEAF
jgi:hypothetical protein